MHLQCFPSGVRLGGLTVQVKEGQKRGGGKRGAVKGLSAAAAARLRWWLVAMHVPEVPIGPEIQLYGPPEMGCQMGWVRETGPAECWAVTRTIHRAADPDDWRACAMRWRKRCEARGWAETWRVELQRRKVPHCHSSLWVPAGTDPDEIKKQWLQATGEMLDPDARKNSVMLKPIPCGGWAAYLAAHTGKHKGVQLGWQGKQWGIINKGLYQRMACAEYTLEAIQATWVARLVRRWVRARYGCKIFAKQTGFTRAMDGAVMPSLVSAVMRMGLLDPF